MADRKYVVIAADPWHEFAKRMEEENPEKFSYYPTRWGKFKDSQMDDIEIGGYTPENKIMNSHILFLASFHNNDAILSQFQVLVVLCESFVSSITLFMPYYPVGTMERVLREGQVATANTIARMISTLPGVGRPLRVMIYDVHTLQNRFYFFGHAIASLHSAIPLVRKKFNLNADTMDKRAFDAVAFPDEGASKRFGTMFPGLPLVICGKTRKGSERIVTVHEGDPNGKDILIVDDLVRSGGTLNKAAQAMLDKGAKSVSAYVTHCGGATKDLKSFLSGGSRSGVLKKLYVSNSVPTALTDIPEGDTIEVIDLFPQLILDL
eukprot:m.341796 g.341796  ORF g.341796 m.341796 type:complete len:321 (-) comp20510_c0_seq1:73-1035(-)